jgi:GAF domain-containing protein
MTDPSPDPAFARLHTACAALGTRLFTVSINDEARDLCWRAYTSMPREYPLSGTKPLTRDGWYDQCIAARQTFVANTPPEFALYFFDHELITSLGLGSCINIPVVEGDEVLGTINLLAEAGHFTPQRIAACQALVQADHAALARAMSARPRAEAASLAPSDGCPLVPPPSPPPSRRRDDSCCETPNGTPQFDHNRGKPGTGPSRPNKGD